MTVSARNVEVYTIGHSNVAVDRLVQLLQKYRIDVLVDVRSIPYSKYAIQFNRDNLAEKLQESNIEYKFAGNFLGGRPADPKLYKSNKTSTNGEESPRTVDYDKIADQDWFQNAIEHLIETAKERRTTIMCGEEDPERCHRYHLVGRTLVRIGVKVWHIRGNGNLERQVDLSIFQDEKPE